MAKKAEVWLAVWESELINYVCDIINCILATIGTRDRPFEFKKMCVKFYTYVLFITQLDQKVTLALSDSRFPQTRIEKKTAKK